MNFIKPSFYETIMKSFYYLFLRFNIMNLREQALVVTLVSTPVPQSPQKLVGPVELLKSSWGVFKKGWKTFVPIVLLPTIVMYIGLFLFTIGSPMIDILAVIIVIFGGVYSIVMTPILIPQQ